MLFHRRKVNRTKGQALVEFALALPILLLIVFGFIETGRALFIKSSVINAAREAVRYGSATGGTDADPNLPRYRDCNGIIAAAQNSSFINNIEIKIWLDHGPDDINPREICPPAPSSDKLIELGFPEKELADPSKLRWRMVVEVSSDFVPVIPLPGFGNLKFSSKSARTIIGTVYLEQK